MSNINEGLPVRSESDAQKYVRTKTYDAATGAKGQDVDVDGNAKVSPFGQDSDGVNVRERLSQQGHSTMNGVYDAATNKDPSQVGLVAMEENASPADAQQILRLTAKPNIAGTIRALQIALLDSSAAPFTKTNPLPVEISESTGVEIVDPDKSVAVAGNASANHDYEVTAAKTLLVSHVNVSSSARAEFILQRETGVATDVWDDIDWSFTSSATRKDVIKCEKLLKVAAGVRIRVVKTNTENQAQDLFSTVYGIEV